MNIEFNLQYQSLWGENVFLCGNHSSLGNNDEQQAIALKYTTNNLWSVSIDVAFENNNIIKYYYFIKNNNGIFKFNANENTLPSFNLKSKNIIVYDKWINASNPFVNFLKKPFNNVFYKRNDQKFAIKQTDKFLFKIQAPQLSNQFTLCILGSDECLGNWDASKAIPMVYNNGMYQLSANFLFAQKLVAYKYGVYNIALKQFVHFENGENRFINIEKEKSTFCIFNDGIAELDVAKFSATGVAIPVFSLRSKNSFGVGEFNDIKLMAKWSKLIGVKLIQLLPINDTIESKTSDDSYPYAANSSFALHPLYINLSLVGTLPTEHKLQKAFDKTKRKLNKLSQLDYETTIKYKLAYCKELFLIDNNNFLTTDAFLQFFAMNKHWLTYYAAYSFLRDKYKTADFLQWETYSTINTQKLEKLLKPNSSSYKQIVFWYFLQFHLHLQLTDAVKYTNNLGIALKGDIPIGIGRTSCDAWQHPSLFNMNMQAGAPPDDFAVKGQNWGFPTYNWEAMQQNGFKWWKERFAQMSFYFDAFRIDHILGFFRIWSIPLHAIDGILGSFKPSIPVSINDFLAKNIYIDVEKFTNPYFTKEYLLEIFKNDFDEIIGKFFHLKNDYYFLNENFKTQNKIQNYFATYNDIKELYKELLLNCVNNVILFEEDGSNGKNFHFNIAMTKTHSYSLLDDTTKNNLYNLFIDYFYHKQNSFWELEAYKKLPTLQHTTEMLVCGEDLGMVPQCVPGVMEQLNILSLEVQRMPKAENASFVNLKQTPYLAVVTPSTHDMSTIRGWWEEDRTITQQYYNHQLGHYGEAPQYCEPWIAMHIIQNHLQSPSMFSIFQLQDMFSIDSTLRVENPNDERINVPANPKHYWCYRMHTTIEDLIKNKSFNLKWQTLITDNNR